MRGSKRSVAQVDADKRSVGVRELCRQGERFVKVFGEMVRVIA